MGSYVASHGKILYPSASYTSGKGWSGTYTMFRFVPPDFGGSDFTYIAVAYGMGVVYCDVVTARL